MIRDGRLAFGRKSRQEMALLGKIPGRLGRSICYCRA